MINTSVMRLANIGLLASSVVSSVHMLTYCGGRTDLAILGAGGAGGAPGVISTGRLGGANAVVAGRPQAGGAIQSRPAGGARSTNEGLASAVGGGGGSGGAVGALGLGGAQASGGSSGGPTTRSRASIVGIKDISAGAGMACVVKTDGTVVCWGSEVPPVPRPVAGVSNAGSVSIGWEGGPTFGALVHVCAVIADGSVRCWGEDSYGQASGDPTRSQSGPTTVVGVSSANTVSSGGYHTCARRANGTVTCWGRNDCGQLGNGTTGQASGPVEVVGIGKALKVSAGDSHTCALLSDKRVMCWGCLNGMGPGGGEPHAVAIDMGLENITDLASGYEHNCVISDGGVSCWGFLYDHGTNQGFSATNLRTTFGSDQAVAIETGYDHRCAVLASDSMQCWGNNINGQLGYGGPNDDDRTTRTGVYGVTSFAVGYQRSCALGARGLVWCWGGPSWTTANSKPYQVTGL